MVSKRRAIDKHEGRDEQKLCTIQEATDLLNSQRGCAFFMRLSGELPTVDEDGVPDGKAFPGCGNVKVHKHEAIKAIYDMLKNFEARGGRIRIHLYGHCVFIG